MYFLKEEIKWFPKLWPLSHSRQSQNSKEKLRNAFIYMYQFHNNYSCRIPMYCRSNNLHSNQTYDVCPLTTFVSIEINDRHPPPPPAPAQKKNLPSILSSQVIEFFSKKNIHKYFYFGHISITTAFPPQEPPVFPPF